MIAREKKTDMGVCPNCGEVDNLTSVDITYEGDRSYLNYRCGSCGLDFSDVMEYSHTMYLESGNFYIIKGTQIEGDHEHSIQIAYIFPYNKEVLSDREKLLKEAHKALIREFSFGFNEDEDFDPDDSETYGDGRTIIKIDSVDMVPEEDYDILKKYL